MRPYSGRKNSLEKQVYNYRLSRARRIVENAFGVLATRCRVFHSKIAIKPEAVNAVLKAACVLHNMRQAKTTPALVDCSYGRSAKSGRCWRIWQFTKHWMHSNSNGNCISRKVHNIFLQWRFSELTISSCSKGIRGRRAKIRNPPFIISWIIRSRSFRQILITNCWWWWYVRISSVNQIMPIISWWKFLYLQNNILCCHSNRFFSL